MKELDIFKAAILDGYRRSYVPLFSGYNISINHNSSLPREKSRSSRFVKIRIEGNDIVEILDDLRTFGFVETTPVSTRIPPERTSPAKTARFRIGLTLFFVHLLSQPHLE